MMRKLSYLTLLCTIFCTSCTISMSNISTKGQASDVIDENQDASPTVSPDISIPAVGL